MSQDALVVGLTRWRVTSELAKPHECTLVGILARCGGACCRSAAYWPPRAYGNPDHTCGNLDHTCGNLGPAGCVLAAADKPVTCLLYPLVLRGGMIRLHSRTRVKNGICKGNHGNGPPMIDALRDNLTELFGADQVARVRADVLAGHQSWVEPPPAVVAAVQQEALWETANTPPTPRSHLPLTVR